MPLCLARFKIMNRKRNWLGLILCDLMDIGLFVYFWDYNNNLINMPVR